VCRKAAACVGVSEASTAAFGSVGVERDRLAFIPLGVDPDAAPAVTDAALPESLRRFRASEGFRILYLGSLIPRKSVHTLVSAHERLEREGHRVVTAIVGDGPCEGEIHADVRRRGLQSVILAGSQPPALVPEWLRSAEILALPSLSEGRPTVVIEALAYGLPVVATDIPGTRELVAVGRTGFLVPPGDDVGLASKLRELLENPTLRRAMADEIRRRVDEEGLTTAGAARRYSALYHDVARAWSDGRR
jgi:glycosyltransferase involved in cell wall biosynthesis